MSRRMRDPAFRRFFVGRGIDIGSGRDPLSLYAEFFPIVSVRLWDLDDGDAEHMNGVDDETFDFVHSSHCLEHLRDPVNGLQSWWRILKRGGHLIVLVPDEDMYEQGVWPSTFNPDHKWSFTIFKRKSWSPVSINLLDMLRELRGADIIKIERLIATFHHLNRRFDQTMSYVTESAIEFILRKE